MTNPHVAKAVALSYFTDLFAASPGHSRGVPERVAAHVINNARAGHDGYPVIKVVGKNRLVVEFDLDVKPFSEAIVVDEDHGEAGAELLADAHTPEPESPTHSDGYALPGEEDAAKGNLGGVTGEQAADGYRSPWMDAGDAAKDAEGN